MCVNAVFLFVEVLFGGSVFEIYGVKDDDLLTRVSVLVSEIRAKIGVIGHKVPA